MGPDISNLCFADDMLFTKASEVQMERVLHCFTLFADSSGQKVSIAKTKIYFSKNVSSMLERAISHKSGFAKTDDLEKYLGVPLLHRRINEHTYSSIIKNM